MKSRLAVGHSAALAEVPNWDIPTLAGAGALRSTANDMLTFLGANLGYVKTPLAQAMAEEVSIRRPVGGDMEIAYGWHVQSKDGNSIIWHNGGTGGYRTYMGFDPKARTGVVVLANVSTAAGPDDIGRHLLNASYPLTKVDAPVEHKEITLDAKTLDRYVGTYQMDRYVLMTMSRDGQRIYTELTGQPKFEVFPESERKFFLKVVDAQLTFDVDAQRVTLHQNGNDIVARRLNESEAKAAAEGIEAHKADVAKRFKEQKQSAGTEAAVRRSIGELQSGEAKYELMTDAFAAVARKSWPTSKAVMAQFGALQSVKFTGVGPGGADIYEVQFEKAKTEWRIMLDEAGKTAGLSFRPL
jgi:hypothetical protein